MSVMQSSMSSISASSLSESSTINLPSSGGKKGFETVRVNALNILGIVDMYDSEVEIAKEFENAIWTFPYFS